MFRFVVVLLAACLPGWLAICAPNRASAQDVAHRVLFKDWSVTCSPNCQLLPNVSSTTVDPNQFKIVIARRKSDGDPLAVMSVPIGVYLTPGIMISVDGKRPFQALYEVCDATKCHAGFKLAGLVLKAFKQGQSAKVRVWLQKDQVADFSISLSGFTIAYTYLQKQGAS